ncbi:DNA-dependent DNA polymerase [Red-eared slider adenovirus 1]|uniref:DNA polymerase n=3 Tax=Adenoviridae TaxID=10508 RepID=J7FX78_9ADEN|nr:DNA-dependent DNA polymerase [Red-eared slider adenovirus 1]AFP53934.2 DNA-dependent DNA polymerase [Red-eared slider adenovirus 1]
MARYVHFTDETDLHYRALLCPQPLRFVRWYLQQVTRKRLDTRYAGWKTVAQTYDRHGLDGLLRDVLKPTRCFVWLKRPRRAEAVRRVYAGYSPPAAEAVDSETRPDIHLYRADPRYPEQLTFIRKLIRQEKCADCGTYVHQVEGHVCQAQRRNFFYVRLGSGQREWKPINFVPLGDYASLRRVYLTYDIETYVQPRQDAARRLRPFMLVFSLSAETEAVFKFAVHAVDALLASGLVPHLRVYSSRPATYYWMLDRTEKDQYSVIAEEFKRVRNGLYCAFVDDMIRSFLAVPGVEAWLKRYARDHDLERLRDISFAKMSNDDKKELAQLWPDLREDTEEVPVPSTVLYVIGHNIAGFDEILLASHIIQENDFIRKYGEMVEHQRVFMPRKGRLLFNDSQLCLPHPYLWRESKDPAVQARVNQARKLGYKDCAAQPLFFVKLSTRDTFLLTHAPLRDVSRAYGLESVKGSCPFAAVNHYFEHGHFQLDGTAEAFPRVDYWKNPAEYRDQKELWLRERKSPTYDLLAETLKYCVLDVQVTEQLVHRLVEQYNHFVQKQCGLPHVRFNIFSRPTISSTSQSIFKQLHFTQHARADKRQKEIPGIYAPNGATYDFIRQSIRGGRCYPSYLGPYTGPVYVYDISGMYASALTYPFPYGMPLDPAGTEAALASFQDYLCTEGYLNPLDFDAYPPAIFQANLHPPEPTLTDTLPPICSRDSGRLCWTNEFMSGQIITSVDALTLHNRGWMVVITHHTCNTVFPQWQPIARDYVAINIASKEQADREGNQILRSIAKLLSNALYGSFATRADDAKLVFESQYENSEWEKLVKNGTYEIVNVSGICCDAIRGTMVDPADLPPTLAHSFEILPVTSQDVTLLQIKPTTAEMSDNRYPSQIASFVLAWTRAFISDWASFLFRDHWGKTLPEERPLMVLYGDTDSMFLTQAGHEAMLRHGSHRLKPNVKKSLSYDPGDLDLTWAVECETQCEKCHAPAFSDESVFLAPKIYALKALECTECGFLSRGKLRAKGHAKHCLDYDLLLDCYRFHTEPHLKKEIIKKHKNRYVTFDGQRFYSSRQCLKRTLQDSYGRFTPFSIHENKLVRELRPWADPTQRFLGPHVLLPYCEYDRNPRPVPTPLLDPKIYPL